MTLTDAQKARARAVALFALALAVVAVAAYSAGRYAGPQAVEVREVERIVWKDRIVEKVVTKVEKAKAATVYVDRVVTKEGEVRERIITRTVEREAEAKAEEKTTVREGNAEKVAEVKATARPDWRVGVLVGASLQPPALPIAGPLVVGVAVERRILGGISAGVWANTGGAAGASLSVEF